MPHELVVGGACVRAALDVQEEFVDGDGACDRDSSTYVTALRSPNSLSKIIASIFVVISYHSQSLSRSAISCSPTSPILLVILSRSENNAVVAFDPSQLLRK